MACDRCAQLNRRIPIRAAEQLAETIQLVRRNVESGTLTEVSPHTDRSAEPFRNLLEVGPWPDFIEHHFCCGTCGKQFRLVVETYKGTGGAWTRHNSLDQAIEGVLRRLGRLISFTANRT